MAEQFANAARAPTRWLAARVLGSLGRDAVKHADALLTGLGDDSEATRAAAADALGWVLPVLAFFSPSAASAGCTGTRIVASSTAISTEGIERASVCERNRRMRISRGRTGFE